MDKKLPAQLWTAIVEELGDPAADFETRFTLRNMVISSSYLFQNLQYLLYKFVNLTFRFEDSTLATLHLLQRRPELAKLVSKLRLHLSRERIWSQDFPYVARGPQEIEDSLSITLELMTSLTQIEISGNDEEMLAVPSIMTLLAQKKPNLECLEIDSRLTTTRFAEARFVGLRYFSSRAMSQLSGDVSVTQDGESTIFRSIV